MFSIYTKELSTEMEIVYGKVFRGKAVSKTVNYSVAERSSAIRYPR